ncbi:hypothetical protein SAMN05444349_14141 [Bacteroides faecichinchillae]|uniref:Uncharacterized protein n=1 Tax=Bacteroides faecichinchillae TaxID=871325 RepID=A0A1M5F6L1_9BACE|nr:hypothetical protein [Bacteroides faecichinchillae]SHF87186.1 hypothetical protein SAMN05444349_14141 [Bacteroides faecichinchillae]
MVGDIRIKRRKDKYCVMVEQGDGRYFTIDGGKCDSKEEARTVKRSYQMVRNAVNKFNSKELKLSIPVQDKDNKINRED